MDGTTHRLVVRTQMYSPRLLLPEPVVRDERLVELVRALKSLRADRLAVVRVDPIDPEVGRPGPLLGGVSEDLLDGWG